MSYTYFLFCDQSITDPMSEIGNALELLYANSKARKGSIEKENDHITITFIDYKFIFTLIEKNWVLEESKDIAETFGKNRKDYNTIKTSRTRIEFYGEEDPNMNYFNEHLFILEEIQREMSITIFDADNGKFFDEL